MSQTVAGFFSNFQSADVAVRKLQRMGVDSDDVSVITHNEARGRNTSDTSSTEVDEIDEFDDEKVGPGEGAMLGGITGLVVGLGAMLIPGIGPVLAAGPLATSLAGAGLGAVTGAVVGPVVSALMNEGVPKEQAEAYAEGIRRGGTLVLVLADDDEVAEVEDALESSGATDINNRSSRWRNEGWKGYSADAPTLTSAELEKEYTLEGTATPKPANTRQPAPTTQGTTRPVSVFPRP